MRLANATLLLAGGLIVWAGAHAGEADRHLPNGVDEAFILHIRYRCPHLEISADADLLLQDGLQKQGQTPAGRAQIESDRTEMTRLLLNMIEKDGQLRFCAFALKRYGPEGDWRTGWIRRRT